MYIISNNFSCWQEKLTGKVWTAVYGQVARKSSWTKLCRPVPELCRSKELCHPKVLPLNNVIAFTHLSGLFRLISLKCPECHPKGLRDGWNFRLSSHLSIMSLKERDVLRIFSRLFRFINALWTRYITHISRVSSHLRLNNKIYYKVVPLVSSLFYLKNKHIAFTLY